MSARMAARMPPSAAAHLLEKPRWAVAGDVLNAAKPASRVVASLRGQPVDGRTVALINPRDATGECYKSFAEIGAHRAQQRGPSCLAAPPPRADGPRPDSRRADAPIDVLNLCINSHSGLKLIEEAAEKGVKKCFIQPGAGSAEIEAFCTARGIEVFNGCVMVELGGPH